MAKLTHSEVGYGLPEECCANCSHSYQSAYGDCQCSILVNGNTVDRGGRCSHYHNEPGIVLAIPEPVKDWPTPGYALKGSCVTCTYSFMQGNTPTCMNTGKSIPDVNKRCKEYQEEVA